MKKYQKIIGIMMLLIASITSLQAQKKSTKMEKVSFVNNYGIKVVGNLNYPAGFDSSKKYAAIISVGPASGVKEQTAGLYASKLAEKGFITIAIDPSYQGESGGEPRFKEDPVARVEDIRGTVDYLVSLPYVDEEKIGVIGICAGGGYVANAAMTERRIKAVASIVPVNGGAENRAAGQKATIETLEMIAKQRTVEARGGEPMIGEWIPDEYKKSEDLDLKQAYEYYRSSRGATPNWPNKMRFVTMDAVMPTDMFYLTDMLLTQPLQIITGSKIGAFGSKKDGKELYEKAASTQKDLMVLEDASHFDLYDNLKYVDQAMAKSVSFFNSNLK